MLKHIAGVHSGCFHAQKVVVKISKFGLLLLVTNPTPGTGLLGYPVFWPSQKVIVLIDDYEVPNGVACKRGFSDAICPLYLS
jgi:hypothetical protein